MSDETKREAGKDGKARSPGRRKFLRQSGALTGAALMGLVPAGVRQSAWAAGSDAPEKKEVKIGFIPLTDCASVVMASVHGIRQEIRHQDHADARKRRGPSVRDKLVNGELDAAHVLYGLIYGVQMGIGGPKKDMAVLMSLNNNGQAITLSNKLNEKGVKDGAGAEGAHRTGKSASTPSRRPSRPAPTRCGCTTGSRPTASTRSRT